MTPDRYAITLTRIADIVEVLRHLEIPPEAVHSIDVAHWSQDSQVSVHVSGDSDAHRELVDRIGDHYGLPADDGKTTNYTRGGYVGATPVLVFCGRSES